MDKSPPVSSRAHVRFEVEKVIGVSSDGNYQVQWAPAWVSKFHLVGCEHLIQEFLQQQVEKAMRHNQVDQFIPILPRDTSECEFNGGQISPKYQCENDIAKRKAGENVIERSAEQYCEENPLHSKDLPTDIDRANDEMDADDSIDSTLSQLSSLPAGRKKGSSGGRKSSKTIDELLQSWVCGSKSIDFASSHEAKEQPELCRVAKPDNKDGKLDRINVLKSLEGFSQHTLTEDKLANFELYLNDLPIERDDGQFEAGQREPNVSNVPQSPNIDVDMLHEESVPYPSTAIKLRQIIENTTSVLNFGLGEEGYNNDPISPDNLTGPSSLDFIASPEQPEANESIITDSLLSDSTGNKSKHTCIICQEGFSSASALKSHVKIHCQAKRWKCPECTFQARSYSHLSSHFCTHTSEKPYSCTQCPWSFKRNNHLVRHMRRHTAEKRYNCSHCKAVFLQQSILKCHTLFHTGENPFHCEGCGRSFRFRRGYDKHIKCCSGTKE